MFSLFIFSLTKKIVYGNRKIFLKNYILFLSFSVKMRAINMFYYYYILCFVIMLIYVY